MERGATRAGEWGKVWVPSSDGSLLRPGSSETELAPVYVLGVVLKDDGGAGYGEIGDGALGRGTFTAQ